jgi:putative ABC transport system ATP-binding protein
MTTGDNKTLATVQDWFLVPPVGPDTMEPWRITMANSDELIISLRGVHKVYPLGKTEVHALQGVDFDIARGDFISIAGPSGSGKSTALNLVGCIDTPTQGEVSILGQKTSDLSDRALTDLRHDVIGFIFQSFNLIPVLNVYENVEFPLLLGNGEGLNSRFSSVKEQKEWIRFLVAQVGLEKWLDHKPAELSGGQRQRVAIARALVCKPQIVLADEPTANLDSATGDAILALMKKINAELSTTFIFSTHDARIVELADHVIRLKDGKIVENRRSGSSLRAEGALA